MTATPPIETTEFEDGRIIERPDGFYWQSLEGGREHGPFEDLEDALADMQGGDESDADDDEGVREAEEALGVPEWVDPETGELADDEHTRIEDH